MPLPLDMACQETPFQLPGALQVQHSDVGNTIPGVTAENTRQFLYELIQASVLGEP